MKIGIGAFVADGAIRPDVLGRAVEERGFESLFVTEHSHIPVSRESPFPLGGPMPDYYARLLNPFVALTAAAVVTSRITLGTGIALMTQRDVIYTAKEVASLDVVSDGRVLFGVAPGWNKEQMRNHGTDPSTRGALLDEQLQALRAIWTQEEAEFHGRFVDFDPIWSWPKPVQKPLPLYVGGWGPAAARRATVHGDGWLHGGALDPDGVKAQFEMRAEYAPGAPMSVFGADGDDLAVLDAYRDGGAERVAVVLEPASESDSLARLDELAGLVRRYG
ncbi:LLM class F420-dependent oxidoreductase [Pseudonocardia benzenivorans]|jgi:probable F420-dependent oxidoreductase|uniref:F420-dependent oxidoreductase n=2 Tax=Pseudonocardia TaxID=1847 RepID=F4CPF4_PSEUX|nr:LLM class F420-dependent oxidoreductase [Pseudonocardia dioxanivorans]AEA24452.1 putative F420-dependent oxidoreductase [Pseudonocardia dioxanivorans CB1190]GJF01141.1 LLM class F420-dependent oxidoreductase [Pseudonocardia sp. D17]